MVVEVDGCSLGIVSISSTSDLSTVCIIEKC